MALAAFCSACGDQPDPPCRSWGQPCRADGDCGCGSCVAEPDQPARDLKPLALVCGEESDGAPVNARCALASDCSRGICILAGTCGLPCDQDRDCSPLQRCASVYARVSETAAQVSRACLSIADLPSQDEAKSTVLAGFFEDADGGAHLDLPPVRQTTLFVLEHLDSLAWPSFTDCRSPVCIDSLRTRDADPVVLFDRALYSHAWNETEEAPLNPVDTGSAQIASQSNPVTIMLPNGPRSARSDAGFQLVLTAEKAGDLRWTELSASGSGTSLDLNLFYLGGHDWAPRGERGPPLVSDALDRFDEIYAQAEIRIGKVRQVVVAGGLRKRFETIAMRYGVLEDLPRLFALSAGAGNRAINLFFVREIEGQNGETRAISGGIPGPQGMHGTGASGVAIGADSMDDAQALGEVIAHEVGHFLGLFHTSESGGTVLDPLPDTPECRPVRDADGNGVLSPKECQGYGADNLLFWAMNSGTKITADQAAVLHSALILK